MVASAEPGSEAAGLEIHTLVRQRLRSSFPWMKDDAILKAAASCAEVVRTEIETQLPIMRASKERIGFLSLSPELRNHIYELAFDKSYVTDITTAQEQLFAKENVEPEAIGLGLKQPPLTKICRQVRTETLPIFYSRDFQINIDGDTFNKIITHIDHKPTISQLSSTFLKDKGFKRMTKWLQAIGSDNTRLVAKLSVYVDSDIPPWVCTAEELQPRLHDFVLAAMGHFKHASIATPSKIRIMGYEGTVNLDYGMDDVFSSKWKELAAYERTCDDA